MLKKLFVPAAAEWKGKVAPFHEVLLRGYFVVLKLAGRDSLVCIYANGVKFRRLDGRETDTFPEIENDLLHMIRAMRIVPLK